ncbi:uncharacterized protein LOC110095816 isoform X2 [Dendrobium catenatum]|uniref:uncharacterized protein LOC110095816 isoform X1 n=1 Tax=Dendrobium catenatum TaxID=906689 RepID=UPI00109F776B|nr:uncharacterized protein LOC110095816 isoform X1 [Dendrobium catenatum]XP_028555440.1 uncharacterized protein LOC110095816 isoform X2 [Dendrobium catenatum]
MHLSNSYPKNLVIAAKEPGKEDGKESFNFRGRSASIRPYFWAPSKTHYVEKLPGSSAQDPASNPPVKTIPTIPSTVNGLPLLYQPHSPPPSPNKMLASSVENTLRKDIPDTGVSFNLGIPNLNSPNAAASSSSTNLQTQSTSIEKDFVSPNKFDILNLEGDVKDQTVNSSDDTIIEEPNFDLEEKEKKQKAIEKTILSKITTTSKKPTKGKQGKKVPSKQNS